MEKYVLKVSELEKNMGKTQLSEFLPVFKYLVESGIRSNMDSDNFVIPNVDNLCTEPSLKGLEEKLLDIYNSWFADMYSNIIPNSIKVNQAILIDGLAFGVNINTFEVNLYTLNVETLFGLGIDADKVHKTCMARNVNGILHAYRIDIEYLGNKEFQYKAVNLNRNKYLYASETVLFPYYYFKGIMELFAEWLNRGYVLETVQDVGGILKRRYITKVEKVLKKFTDCEDAVSTIEPTFYPLKGYMYLPVVGAPSTTAMVSKVDLFSLNRVSPVRTMRDIAVEKVKNPINDIITKSVILQRMSELERTDSWTYMDVMYNLPKSEKYFADLDSRGLVNTKLLSKYLNSLNDVDLNTIVSMIPEAKSRISYMSGLFKGSEMVDLSKENNSSIRAKLRKGIYSVISINKDGSYSSQIVTNDRKILSAVYGENYFAELEGVNVKINEMRLRLAKGESLEDVFRYCGFSYEDEELVNAAKEFIKNSEGDDVEKAISENVLRESALNSIGVQGRAESSTSSILVRKVFGIRNSDGTVGDYYRYVSYSKLVRMIKIG